MALIALLALAQSQTLEPVGNLAHPPIDESSGLIASREHPGVFWTHNDSGDVPRLFAVTAEGDPIVPTWFADRVWTNEPEEGKEMFEGLAIPTATNSDWEDIAIGDGELFIGDVGNNGNARRDLGVYVVSEPNPFATVSSRPLKWLPVRYPDQIAFPADPMFFDCEGMFVMDGKLHLVTKHRGTPEQMASTKLYRLDTEHTDQVNVLTFLDSRDEMLGWVTASDLSPDEEWLALLVQAPEQGVWLIRQNRGQSATLNGPSMLLRLEGIRQAEAIAWDLDGESLLITNEQRDIYRVTLDMFDDVP